MTIGVPKEIKEQEHRVGLLPSGAYQLVKNGHRVLVGRGAGVGAGFHDEEYVTAGATLVDDHAQIFAEAELIVKVKEPLPGAYARTATQALTNVTFRFVEMLADHGLSGACERQPALMGGINVQGGRVTCRAVAFTHGFDCHAPVL